MKSLKAALLGATILAGAGVLSGADAADVYSRGSIKDTGPVDYLPAISWGGFYFGVNAGGLFLENEDGVDDEDDTFSSAACMSATTGSGPAIWCSASKAT
jgi:hypothetical protein